MQVLIVGHRGTGKTTVGERLADLLELPFIDVDAEIEEHAGQPCEVLVTADRESFRQLESRIFNRIIDGEPSAVVSAGAGLEEISSRPLTIWLARDGWEEAAENDRARLRPDMTWEEELAWMRDEREPRWAEAAHLHYRIPRGRPAARAARDLAFLVDLVGRESNDIARTTWVVPSGPDEIDRAMSDVERFGFAGLEIRSDAFDHFPATDLPVLASIRSPDVGWVQAALASADAIDVDVAFVDALTASGALEAAPRSLFVSLHSSSVEPDEVNELAATARNLQSAYPDWAPHVGIKYAPQVIGFAELGMARALIGPLRRAGVGVTFVPQGSEFDFFRPIVAAENATNYVSVGLRPSRFESDAADGLTVLDAQDWLLVAKGPVPTTFDALIGDPVDGSQGDLWHRRAALEDGESTGYVKTRVTVQKFEPAIDLLADLGIRGISVTSPLKSRASFICPDDSHFGRLLDPEDSARGRVAGHPVRNGNTLVRVGDGWHATDTDEDGMRACLEWFVERGIGPATIAVFGQGGVSEALLRAIEASDWFLVHHASAREGWTDECPPFVTLVINAGGPQSSAHDGFPRCRGWVDLHYVDVADPPEDVVHLNGDVFFDAQATAQRRFWASRAR